MKKHTLEYVKGFFREYGCDMLEEEYKNAHNPMKYICSCGNISKISFSSFKNGRRCKKCGNKKSSEKQSLTFEYVYNCFKEQNCELLEKEYINAHYKMKYRCVCGNISKINFNNFKQGKRCIRCAPEKKLGKNNHNYNPNLTDEEREANKDRHSDYKYIRWIKQIYVRDDYTCQKCLVKGGNLNSHHIESWGSCKKLRLDKDNGITFCKSCHKQFHKEYSYGNNNRQQLEEFLEIVLSHI